MDGKGNDSLIKTSKVTEWTFNNSGYISLLFGGFLIAGCISAYIIAVARGNVEPFLPLISDAAGSPPQNGLFGTLVTIGGMIGVIFMLLRYMIVMEKNQEKSKMVIALNKFSLAVGTISMCAITLVTGYPVNFYRNKDVWLSDVGIPHMIGGIVFFAFGIIYVAIQSIITLFQHTKDKLILMLRVLICMGCCVTFVYHIVTVPDHFRGLSHLYYSNTSDSQANDTKLLPYPATLGSSLKLPIDTSGTYLASAITEWLLVFLLCGFFFTFFNEAQEYSLLVVVETQCSQAETLHEVSSPDSSGKSPAVPEKQESEVKTIFRRDSSCQTADENAVSTKPNFKTFEKGKYVKRQISSFDMLSGDKLEKLIESHVKKNRKLENKNSNGDLKTNDFKISESLKEVDDESAENELENTNENSSNVTTNGISNNISKTGTGLVEGTTDRGC